MTRRACNILIDFDGTLNDTESVFASRLNGLFHMDGRELYRIYLQDIHRKIVHEQYPDRHDDRGLHCRLLLRRLGESPDDKKVDLLTTVFEEAEKSVLENLNLFSEVPEFLDRIVESGYHLCLSTGGGNSLKKADAVTKILGRNYFENVVGEEIIDRLKHESQYYRVALKTLSWRAEDTFSVGDTIITDIFPAKLVGITTIWVNRNKDNAPAELMMMPDYTTHGLLGIAGILTAHLRAMN